MKIVVLGIGRQGKDAIKDLLDESTSPGVEKVLAVDINEEIAKQFVKEVGDPRLSAAQADATKPDELAKVLKGYDSTINLTLFAFNPAVMRACLKAGTHYTGGGGLFHQTKEQLAMHDDFKNANLIGVPCCGGSPGVMNILAKVGADRLDEIDEIHCRIGSGPAVYTLHSEPWLLSITHKDKGVKTVTFKQTLRPEMMEPLKMLVDLGLCSSEPIEVGGVKIVPYDFIVDFIEKEGPAKSIFGYSGRTIVDEFVIPAVEYIDGKWVDFPPLSEAEMITFPEILGDQMGVPEIIAKGRIKGDPAIVLVSQVKEKGGRWTRTVRTGQVTSFVAQWMANGTITKRGVFPPGQILDTSQFFQEMKKRGYKGLFVTTMLTQKG